MFSKQAAIGFLLSVSGRVAVFSFWTELSSYIETQVFLE